SASRSCGSPNRRRRRWPDCERARRASRTTERPPGRRAAMGRRGTSTPGGAAPGVTVTPYEGGERPDGPHPGMVVGLRGWGGAGLGAGKALASLLATIATTTVAVFDSDTLLDHRARRPVMHLSDGINTGLTWPRIELRAGRDRAGRDLLLLMGAE